MIKPYTEKTFSIDLIADLYQTSDSSTIKEKCKSDLNVEITESEIMDYLDFTEDFEKESRKIMMNQIFN